MRVIDSALSRILLDSNVFFHTAPSAKLNLRLHTRELLFYFDRTRGPARVQISFSPRIILYFPAMQLLIKNMQNCRPVKIIARCNISTCKINVFVESEDVVNHRRRKSPKRENRIYFIQRIIFACKIQNGEEKQSQRQTDFNIF